MPRPPKTKRFPVGTPIKVFRKEWEGTQRRGESDRRAQKRERSDHGFFTGRRNGFLRPVLEKDIGRSIKQDWLDKAKHLVEEFGDAGVNQYRSDDGKVLYRVEYDPTKKKFYYSSTRVGLGRGMGEDRRSSTEAVVRKAKPVK